MFGSAPVFGALSFSERHERWLIAALEKLFFLSSRRLVATALLARDHAAVVSFDAGGYRAAVLPLPWADADAARADANGDVPAIIPPATVPVVVAVTPDLNIDGLGHL
jgi:hypothetical protein